MWRRSKARVVAFVQRRYEAWQSQGQAYLRHWQQHRPPPAGSPRRLP